MDPNHLVNENLQPLSDPAEFHRSSSQNPGQLHL